jgi:hypothetical protein
MLQEKKMHMLQESLLEKLLFQEQLAQKAAAGRAKELFAGLGI